MSWYGLSERLYARRKDGARLGWPRRNGQAGLFSVADAQALPSQDGSFDVMASALVINFVGDKEQALRETRRVNAPATGDACLVGETR